MKKTILLFALTSCMLAARAQAPSRAMRISGSIHSQTEALIPRLLPRTIDEKQRMLHEDVPCDSLIIQLLYGDGHYTDHELAATIGNNGRFTSGVDIPYPVFALLKNRNDEFRVLLTPGEDLDVQITNGAVSYSGPTRDINRLIDEFHLGSLPWYLQPMMDTNALLKLGFSDFRATVVDSVERLVKLFESRVDKATPDESIRELLKTEFRYSHQCYLYDVGTNYMRWVNNSSRDSVIQLATALYPVPDGRILRNGFFANMMLSYQLKQWQTVQIMQFRRDSAAFRSAVARIYQMPYDSALFRINRDGERIAMSWLYARIHLNPLQQEKILFNKVINAYSDAALGTCLDYFDTLRLHFPRSIYLPLAAGPVARIRATIAAQAGNPRIRFHTGVDSTLAAIMEPYRGSVVYVDLWGTWCGPCQQEMRFVPALKQRFRNKSVKFIYLDLDEDDKNEKWISYVRFISLEGEHYRLTRAGMQPLWREIQSAGGGPQQYPTYLIFDRAGRLVTPAARRPSDGEALYAQLDSLL